ncbi:MAG: response regulator [Candidatus Promineifilaceae bacterium]
MPDNHSDTHILVVDDEPDIAESLGDFLIHKEGYQVSRVYSGEDAIIFLQETADGTIRSVDLVLLDVMMPGISGLEVLAWIRDHPTLQFLRVIVLTAVSGRQKTVEALSIGADDYITKPYHYSELVARVKTILRSRELEKQLQHQSHQLAMLNQVSRAVTATLSVNDVLKKAAKGAHTILGVDLVAIFMTGHTRNRLHCREVFSTDDRFSPADYQPIALQEGVIGRVFSQRRGVFLNKPESGASFKPGVDAPSGFTVQAFLACPLVVRGRAVGVISAFNKLTGPFSNVDRDLFVSLSSSVSRAIEIAWLFQSIGSRQQELLESRNTLQAVIDGILHPIYTINGRWQLVAVNKTKADEMERPSASFSGQLCYQAFFGRKEPCEHCQAAYDIATQQASRWPVRYLGDDHLPREWDVSAYPIPGAKASSARAVVVWQDRTEERRLENSLMQAGKLAAIGQLAAGVAHEINNPLTAIKANAQMLKMFITPDDENYESVELISKASERAEKVVRGLLDFARQSQYDFELTDVNESIMQALNLVSYQMTSNNVNLSLSLSEELPQVKASWQHLQSVWLNLLINARDALEENETERKVEVISRLDPNGGYIQVLVEDNGRGMTEAELIHIFEPFYTTKAPGQGTGLGLATSHRIIEQHSGEISVLSERGKGTTFVIRLPAYLDEEDAAVSVDSEVVHL